MSFTSTPTAAWRRDFGLVVVGRGMSWIGDEIVLLALLLRASHTSTNPGVLVAALMLAAAVPSLLLAPWAGLIVDRAPTKAVVVTAALAQAAVCGLLVVSASPPATVLLVAALNAGQAVASPAWFAVIPAIVPEDHRAAAVSTSQAVTSGAAIAGPALGGLIVGLGGTTAALLANAATFVVLAICGAALRRQRRPERSPETASLRREALAGVVVIRRDTVLWTLVSLLTLFIVACGAVNVAEVFLITQVLGAGPTAYGLVGAAFAGGMLAGALLARRRRTDIDSVRQVLFAVATMVVGLAGCGLAPTVVVVAAASALVGIGNGTCNVRVQQLILTRVASTVLGRVMAAMNACVSTGSIIALVLGAALLTAVGARAMFVGAAVVGACALGAAALPLLRGARTIPAPMTASSGAG